VAFSGSRGCQLPRSSAQLAQYYALCLYPHTLITRLPVRVFRPAVYLRLYHAIRDIIESPTQRVARFTRISPVGRDPFTSESVYNTRATPDACDYNIHLSNSSYAMVCVGALECV
jgi:hypothetical protein